MIRLFTRNLWNEKAGKFQPGVMEVKGERIEAIRFGKPEGVRAKQKIQDLGDAFVGPSAIDLHVHSRDFNEHHKETFESLEASALKGGVRAAACMANTYPRLDSEKRIKDFLQKARSLRVHLVPFAAVTENLDGKKPTDWKNLLRLPTAGLSDDGKPILDENIFLGALLAAKKAGKILSLHEEDTHISKASVLHLSETSMKCGVEGSPEEAEFSLIERDLKIALKNRAPIHFGHVSSGRSVELIGKARRNGASVSAELTPHHGLLSVDEAEKFPIEKLSRFKVCPPIRTKKDREALLQGVRTGAIDCFASDHAPHSSFEKDLPIEAASHGMISVEYFFPLYNEIRLRAALPWKTFYRCLTSRPSELLGLKDRGELRAGNPASFLVFDPESRQNLKWSTSRSSNTPFDGATMRGKVLEHWIKGKKVYHSNGSH